MPFGLNADAEGTSLTGVAPLTGGSTDIGAGECWGVMGVCGCWRWEKEKGVEGVVGSAAGKAERRGWPRSDSA
jgi:hypothetical protein